MIRIPFNWAGNKYDYTQFINTLVMGRSYDRVIDSFLGSGTLLLNMRCTANEYIGNDIIKLIPSVLNYLANNNINISLNDVTEIDRNWQFTLSEHYYTFRDYWNERYMGDEMDKQFVIETVMLLKMCNNSVVRFNQKGEFNQGFRGISKTKERGLGKFFSDASLRSIQAEINMLDKILINRKYEFHNKDFRELLTTLNVGSKELLLMDPPYIITNTSVYGETYKEEEEKYLLDLLDGTQTDFILFNYLTNSDMEHNKLQELIDKNNYKVIVLRNKGKLKSICNTNTSQEVIITNIKWHTETHT